MKKLYDELELPRRYNEYEQATYKKLNALIDAIPETEGGLKGDVFRRYVFKSTLRLDVL